MTFEERPSSAPAGPIPGRVSICIPVYNGGSHLDETLWSARAQTKAPLEILVVDDGSRDASIEIARRHEREDSRVRIAQNPTNLGLTGNWERCVELAQGDWVKFLFQDDLIHPACVEQLCAGMSSSGGSIGFVGRRVLVEEVSRRQRRDFEEVDRRNLTHMLDGPCFLSAADVAALALDQWAVNVIGEPTSVMFHRGILQRYGGFDRSFDQICDWEFWLRVGVNEGLWFDTEVLATFRVHRAGTSLANQRTKAAWIEYGEAALLGCKFLTHPAFEPVRRAAASRSGDPLEARVARRVVRFRATSSDAAQSDALGLICNECGEIPRLSFRIVVAEGVWVRLPSSARRVINRLRGVLRSIIRGGAQGAGTPGKVVPDHPSPAGSGDAR